MAQKSTVPVIRSRKVADGADPLVMLTAYDAPGARMVDEAGADLILVGDSVAMVVLGYEDTLQVTVADIAHHTAAVARTRPSALVVADMPWMSYHVSVEDTLRNAAELVRAGGQAVKLEGGRQRLPMVEALIDAEIARGNAQLAQVSHIRRFHLLTKELDHDDGEVTATMKVRRSSIYKTYAEVIEAMYSGAPSHA